MVDFVNYTPGDTMIFEDCDLSGGPSSGEKGSHYCDSGRVAVSVTAFLFSSPISFPRGLPPGASRTISAMILGGKID